MSIVATRMSSTGREESKKQAIQRIPTIIKMRPLSALSLLLLLVINCGLPAPSPAPIPALCSPTWTHPSSLVSDNLKFIRKHCVLISDNRFIIPAVITEPPRRVVEHTKRNNHRAGSSSPHLCNITSSG